jgi:hypothetical protein
VATFEQTRITVPVVVSGIPVRRFLELHAHLDALVAELAVLAVPGTPTPAELDGIIPLLDALTGLFAAPRRHTRESARRAREQGRSEFALEAELPPAAADLVSDWNRLLDRADAASSRGLLLTPPAPPEVVELRRWIGAQIETQLLAL